MIVAGLGWVMSCASQLAAHIRADVPVDPDGDQARQWILEELSRPEYQAAKPTWWDLLSKAFWDWLNSLTKGANGVLQAPLLVFLVIVIAAVIVAAFFIFGRPRLNRRSSVVGSIFGADENRSADALRRAASAAAARNNWTLAIEELFRALARTLSERVLVSTDPGTTARGFATRASAPFPQHTERLMASAAVFDGVRYLDRPGNQIDYEAIVGLERELRTARPVYAESTPSSVTEASAR